MSQFAGFRAKRERGTEEERSARASDTSRFESGIDNGNCIIHSASSAVNVRRRLAFADVTSRPRHIREPPRVKDDGGRRRRVSPSARHADEHGGNIRAPLPLFPTTSTIDMIGPLSHRVSVNATEARRLHSHGQVHRLSLLFPLSVTIISARRYVFP